MATNKRIYGTSLTMDQRLEVPEHLESGLSIPKLATKYDGHPTTVRRIQRNAVIVNQFTEQGVIMGHRRRLRKPIYEEMDNRLYVWYLEQLALGETLTDLLMLKKAVKINAEYGGSSTFKASRGWLYRFKIRHNIKIKGDADEEITKQFLQNFAQCIEESDIDKENIYNFCQADLIWRNLSTSILVRSGIKDIDGHKPKQERITIGLCTNATGQHKLLPLIINKSANSRVLKSWKHHLPVILKSQQQSFLDADLFFDWYQNYFKPEVLKHQMQTGTCGKVILTVDDSQGNKAKLFERFQLDKQFKIIFYSSNISQNLQPMNQVIDVVKELYRNKMIHKIQSLPDGIKGFYFLFDIKECIDFLHEAWTEISVMCIQIAWKNLVKQSLTELSSIEGFRSQLESKYEDIIDFLPNSIKDENVSNIKTEVSLSNKKGVVESSSNTLSDENKLIGAFKNIMV